ncbi:hypothetical protein K2173_007482 [Erythroxylum novogranatense]|uniref:Uncharacterized protein n=1 Tax=Erythroxylum novogranatense TaxID=1862640 RepID=A0AAV8T6D9_9ROSI|nr:hypothetical protein K2173_007482 [Erythroxylum novogranatense]
MSRCFPYPPPCWSRNGTQFGTVNESIKIQSKKEIITDRQKDKRRGDRHGRKDKIKSKERGNLSKLSSYQGKKSLPPKSVESEAEKSDLTEEHGEPVYCQSLPLLSEGIESSSKRKWDDSTSNDVKIIGNIIRIKLRKNGDRDASFSGDQLCSTTGRDYSGPQQKDLLQVPGSKHIAEELNSRHDRACFDTASKIENKNSNNDIEDVGSSGSAHDALQTQESPYTKHCGDWVPPPFLLNLAATAAADGDNWLFETKKQERNVHENFTLHMEETNQEDYTSWPRARFIPGVDVYSLPYTVPF